MNGAEVCIKGDVKDITTTPASETTGSQNDETDAIVVLPNAARFTLRVGGDIDSMNMAHDNTANVDYYTQTDFPQHADSLFIREFDVRNVSST